MACKPPADAPIPTTKNTRLVGSQLVPVPPRLSSFMVVALGGSFARVRFAILIPIRDSAKIPKKAWFWLISGGDKFVTAATSRHGTSVNRRRHRTAGHHDA